MFYGSVHTDPSAYYPHFAGYADETGAGRGEGTNLNLPLPFGADDVAFIAANARLCEAVKAHGSEALILSAGWDAHRDDPLSKLAVSTDAYARIGDLYGKLGLPTLIVQEGGYSLEAVAAASLRVHAGVPRGARVIHRHPGPCAPGSNSQQLRSMLMHGSRARAPGMTMSVQPRSVMCRGSGFSSPLSTRLTMSVSAALARQGWPTFSPSRTT